MHLLSCFRAHAFAVSRLLGSRARSSRRRLPVVEQLESVNLLTTITASWFSANLHDPVIEKLAKSDWLANQDSLSRTGVIGILQTVAKSATVTTSELADLQTLTANSAALGMTPAVQNLLSKTVGFNLANKQYQGQTLLASGQLSTSSTGIQVGELVNKWFLGLDHPGLTPGKRNQATYVQAMGTLYGSNNRPLPQDIEQGDVGDCYFLSSLGAIAHRMPQAIESMIQSNGDGTYTVGFYNGKTPDYVTVDGELPADSNGLFVYADYGRAAVSPVNVLWPALIEKAYAQLSAEGWSRKYAVKIDPSWNQNNYLSISLGNPGFSMHQITGLSIARTKLQMPPVASQRQQLIADVMARDPITLSTTGRQKLRHGIIQDHVYMLLGYDAKSQKFEILNPYDDGNANPKDGVRQLFLVWKKVVHNYAAWTNLNLPAAAG
jgi:hypothetical protein